MTAPDMVSIIQAALVAHLPSMMCAEGDGFYVECRCGAIGHIESVAANDWEPANQWSAAHQARAVLAAISEAAVGFVALGPDNLGGVEFVDCMPTIAPNIESARSEIADWYADATPYALIPWERAE